MVSIKIEATEETDRFIVESLVETIKDTDSKKLVKACLRVIKYYTNETEYQRIKSSVD